MIPPYSHTLRHSPQFKVSTIKTICSTIKKIMVAIVIIFIVFSICFVIAPIPIRRAVHKVYYHPSLVTNESSMRQLQRNIKPYHIPQKVFPDFPGPTNLSSIKAENNLGVMEKMQKQIKFRNVDTILESLQRTNPGGIRDNPDLVLLLYDKPKITKPEMENLFYNMGGSYKDSHHVDSLFDKIQTYSSISETIEHLSISERTILAKIIPFSSYPGQIPYKLRELSFQILQLAKKIHNHQINAVVAASYIHQAIIRIQPFEAESDTTARVWMNTLLQMGGYKAIVVPKQDYHYMMETDVRHPGYFSVLLEDIIEWNRKPD